jgi:bifunctional DNA-binding transcriptional regulator/antitoxin component of YhaV-PrlF toxin-antitoxin module
MSTITVGGTGEIALPAEVRERFRIVPHTRLRIIETQTGVLLVPLTDEPMSPPLKEEIAEWQSLAGASWEKFGYNTAGEAR